MIKKIVTIEKLAVMVQKGFEGTTGDLQVVKEDLQAVKEDTNLIKSRLDSIEMEILDIRKKLENIVYRHEYEILKV